MNAGRGALRIILLCAALAAAAAVAQAPPPDTLPQALEQAQFLPGKSPRPPADDAPWQPVRLPDNWHLSRPGADGGGWYRIVLPIITVPRRVHAFYLPRDSAPVIRLYVNGQIVGATQRPEAVIRLNQQPFLTAAPPVSFRNGANILHVYIEARSELRQGLTRIWFGDSFLVRALWLERYKSHVVLVIAFAFAVITAGLIALTVWVQARRDPEFFWIGLSAVLLGVPTVLQFFFGAGAPGVSRDALQLLYTHAYAPALALGGLHIARLVPRAAPWLLWGLLVAGCLAPLALGESAFVRVSIVLGIAFLLILAAVFTLVVVRNGRHVPWMRGTAAAALVAAIALAVHDLSIWLGWIDYDRLVLSLYSAPVLTLSLGVLLISRHLEAVREITAARATLEQRVAERTAEIERTHTQLRALEQENARVTERRRIMADIHDGLGASLVSLLSVVQTRHAAPEDVERRVHDALQELRLAVDSLDAPDGDLLTALATIRFRMRDAMEAAGIALEWDVTDVPPLPQLSSAHLLGVQRIVLEALANAIRHARATSVAVSLVAADDHIAVLISDNGRGFDPATLSRVGRGLASMRRRAADAGGNLRVESAPQRGTRVVLTLPMRPPATAA